MKLNSAQGRLKGPEPVKERRAKGNLGPLGSPWLKMESYYPFDGSNSSSPQKDWDGQTWALESRAAFS